MSHGQQCEDWGIMRDNCWIALASENQTRGKERRMGRAGLKDSAEMVKGVVEWEGGRTPQRLEGISVLQQ